ncbi:MAG: hypothetical protein OXG74_08625 [Acidobacteria bacterium]|nr:hypothetical protein [Acidobacteriota bacterium]
MVFPGNQGKMVGAAVFGRLLKTSTSITARRQLLGDQAELALAHGVARMSASFLR